MGLIIFVISFYQRLEPKNSKLGTFFPWKRVFASTFDRSYRSYKDNLPHFEVSVKLRIFNTHIDLLEEKKLDLS
jgi:hypothetical protein